MKWQDNWHAISARIDGLLAAGHFFVQTLRVNSEDPHGAGKYLSNQAADLFAEIDAFNAGAQSLAPAKAAQAMGRFIDSHRTRMMDQSISGLNGLRVRLTALAWLKAEVEYHLKDFEAVAQRLSERAFTHLQQSIIADEGVRRSWQRALGQGETACEKLGGAHLLLHGIWGFKVSGAGARTDLVFSEPVDRRKTESSAEALVLTEWKVVSSAQELREAAETGRKQAGLYQAGILAGIELAGYRYVVLVSTERMPHIEDVQGGSVIYRHVNIAVDPEVPSKAARHSSNLASN